MKAIKRVIYHFFSVSLMLFLCHGISVSAVQKNVAKVIKLRGKAEVKPANSTKWLQLKEKQWVAESSQIKTHAKSFVRILFVDKSKINIGPNSIMTIKKFDKEKAGIISLIKGQIRNQVVKDNLQRIRDKGKHKLYVNTKSAAMGVRGTDFHVFYNQKNENTSLLTYSGSVAMNKLDSSQIQRLDAGNLDKILNADKAVLVRGGEFSGTSPKVDRPSVPVKISPAQFRALKNNQEFKATQTSSRPKRTGKALRSPIPPKISSKTVTSGDKGVLGTVARQMGKDVVQNVEKVIEKTGEKIQTAPPEGFYNPQTKEFAPTNGGIIDTETAIYVPPPKGSEFDANTGVFVVPENLGTVDPQTGEYNAPEGYKLNHDGTFIEDKGPPAAEGQGETRGPASTGGEQGEGGRTPQSQGGEGSIPAGPPPSPINFFPGEGGPPISETELQRQIEAGLNQEGLELDISNRPDPRFIIKEPEKTRVQINIIQE